MPNRDLKESIRRSPSLQLLSDAAERLWYRLITSVDDFGRLEADPEVVFTTCFQRVPKGWNRQKVQLCLHELATKSHPGDRPLISIYRVGMKTFLQILSSPVHIYQRAKTSKYPSQTNQEVIRILPQMRESARECTQIPSVLESRTPSPESRITNPELSSALKCAQMVSRFQEFWQIYPPRSGKRVEKDATEALFLKLSTQDQILAVTAARNYAEALKAQGLSAKDPKRFLRDGQGHEPWRDWIIPAPLSSAQRPPPPPPKNDPIGRGHWSSVYGNPKDHGYT
jgi:hypothetical protein